MIPDEHLNVLRKLYSRIEDNGIDWVVTGSASFALQGVPVTPNDVDIQTDESGAYEIEELFSDRVIKEVEFSSTERIKSHFGALMIHGILVELMGAVQKYYDGEWEPPIDIDRHKKFVSLEGMEIPVLDLAYESLAYRRFGRVETADRLEKFLDGEFIQ
ncbi:MAG: nucleotidyltransferase domain-containing protein [Candidatus Acetothermia bacterium]